MEFIFSCISFFIFYCIFPLPCNPLIHPYPQQSPDSCPCCPCNVHIKLSLSTSSIPPHPNLPPPLICHPAIAELHTHTHTHTHIYIISFFTHLFVNRHVGCFHILAIVNNDAANTGVHISFQVSVFVSFGQIPRYGIAGS